MLRDIGLLVLGGLLFPTLLYLLRVVPTDVDRHDRQIAARDEDLEEWIIVRDRILAQDMHRLGQKINEQTQQPPGSAVWKASMAAAKTNALYAYRAELRRARAFVRDVEERLPHRLWRRTWFGNALGRTADDLAVLEATVDKEGATIEGSRGQTVVHPALVEARQLGCPIPPPERSRACGPERGPVGHPSAT